MPTLVPAYGRDYKNRKEVLAAFEAGKDFIMLNLAGSTYCNKQDLVSLGIKSVAIRYKNNTEVLPLKIV